MIKGIFALALMVLMTCSFAVADGSNFAPTGYDYRHATIGQPNYGSEETLFGNVFGRIQYYSLRNTGGEDLNCTLNDDNNTNIFTTTVTAGSLSLNRTVANYTNFGILNLTCGSIFRTGGSFLNANFTAWLKFDEGTGNNSSNNLSTNAIELGVDNLTRNFSWVSGKIGNATQINGYYSGANMSYFRLNTTAALNFTTANQFTIMLWAKLTAPTVANTTTYLFHQGALSGNYSANGTNVTSVRLLNASYMEFAVRNNNTLAVLNYTANNTTTITGSWMHWAFLYNNTAMSIWLNGTKVANNTYAAATINSSTSAWYFGDGLDIVGMNTSAQGVYGYDELMFFNQTLTSAQLNYSRDMPAKKVAAEARIVAYR